MVTFWSFRIAKGFWGIWVIMYKVGILEVLLINAKISYFVTKTTSQWENYNVTVACVTGRKLTRGEWPLQLDGFVGRWHTINANKQDTFWIRTHFVYDKCNRKLIPDKFYDHSSNPTNSKDQTISSRILHQSLNINTILLV